MWFLRAPAALFGLAALSCLPAVSAKPYPVHLEELRELHNASQIEKRQCNGITCGFYGQLCCTGDQQCFTDSNGQAQCGTGGGNVQQQGEWEMRTTTWVENGPVTRTSVYSTWIGLTAAAQPTGSCKSSQSPCGSLCCDSGFYCAADKSQCLYIGGGSSGGVIVTATGSPTRTVPFETPIATGINGQPEPVQGGGGGLSGGAIAGIVIGVIAGIILLLLLCLFCCAKSLFDAVLAIFGLGKRKKHTKETTYVESHHHSSHHGGAAGWYGHGPSRPSRPAKEGGKFGNLLGIGAGLGALALALGLKRRHDKHDDKSTTISSSYYSDYYTSSSSASSDDRRTRNTRHSRH